jgi:hypothetical protein
MCRVGASWPLLMQAKWKNKEVLRMALARVATGKVLRVKTHSISIFHHVVVM